jgi:dolichyl-phosphate beta-glucosyltransferase
MPKNIKYSVIVPAYSEAMVIENSLKDLAKVLKTDKKRFDKTEVIVVVADSPDGTAQLAEQQASLFTSFTLVEPGKKVGKGRDVRAGILASKGDYVLFTDADMATPPKHIAKAFDDLEDGADVVIGIRPLARVHNTFFRRVRSVVSNIMIRSLAVPGISDTQCGFKAFRANVVKELFTPLETMAWGFDIEILARARAAHYKIKKIRITDWFDPKIGKMGLAGESEVHANLNTLKELLAISYKRLLGKYKPSN